MVHDFETIVNRHDTGSEKYNQMKEWNPSVTEDIVPFSVADMEFKNAPEIIEGLKEYLNDVILGYAVPTEDYYSAVCSWMERRHGWNIEPEWIIGSPGVVQAFYNAVKAFAEPGEGVIIMTPVYYPFYGAIKKTGRKIVRTALVVRGDRYEIDFDELERLASEPSNKVLLFCSPHNPVGRVWERWELEKISEICLKNGVTVISDEIHNDLVMPGFKHTVFAALSDEAKNNCIVCTSPSKTFNLAGMHVSNVIIPNADLRMKYQDELDKTGFFSLNMLGYKACELGYDKGELWLDELLVTIHNNYFALKDFLAKRLPEVKVYPLEGTYLVWMDFRPLGIDFLELERILHMEAMVFFDEGYVFGKREGAGFERMNIACPKQVMMDGLERMANALRKHVR
ncbi:MalY/PatB family protein [Youngiibacter multivorans]|uniref:cysteine-S-conjugate beta-lyase n=1 Tax=Youngiibacter multivorans TaxID=937251 RepID=A0ABS4G3C2_9CLOT|nr:MalY/PatB family protein [Youngiibacter multivorans]MBP1919047.1 aminotransferase/cystathionine beta-lyase [Youngiibacter multivorans]